MNRGLRTPCDKRLEAALKCNFETRSQGFRVSATSSIFSRAAYIWAEELAAEEKSLSHKAMCTAKKIALASAAAADCAYDNLQLFSRAMASGVLARRHIWLRHWEGDSSQLPESLISPSKVRNCLGKFLSPYWWRTRISRRFFSPPKRTGPKRPSPFVPQAQAPEPINIARDSNLSKTKAKPPLNTSAQVPPPPRPLPTPAGPPEVTNQPDSLCQRDSLPVGAHLLAFAMEVNYLRLLGPANGQQGILT